MKINKVFCLFEQSGTFKNEFIKLGIPAEDFDLLNEFGQTDHVIDLFSEIRGGYEGKKSIFDDMTEDDLIFAFFPCVRFENQIMLSLRGQAKQLKAWSMKKKMEYDMRLIAEIKENYDLVNKMFIICMDRKIRLIMENPYSEEHFLRRYWCYPPSIIDKDRRENGDYYAKPTQYWFVNCKPEQNLLFEPITYNHLGEGDAIRRLNSSMYGEKFGNVSLKVARSMIHPQYARRFIKQYILNEEDL